MRLIDANDLLTVTDIRADETEFTYVSYGTIEEAPTVLTIPDNPTNGDVIKAIFPEIFVANCKLVDKVGYFNFDADWWNAPYKPQESEIEDGNDDIKC